MDVGGSGWRRPVGRVAEGDVGWRAAVGVFGGADRYRRVSHGLGRRHGRWPELWLRARECRGVHLYARRERRFCSGAQAPGVLPRATPPGRAKPPRAHALSLPFVAMLNVARHERNCPWVWIVPSGRDRRSRSGVRHSQEARRGADARPEPDGCGSGPGGGACSGGPGFPQGRPEGPPAAGPDGPALTEPDPTTEEAPRWAGMALQTSLRGGDG